MSVVYEASDGVVVVRLERPERMNALSGEMLEELSLVFERACADESLRAVILTGAGERAFSAGTDIKELQHLDVEGARRASLRGQRACATIESCTVPVIAAVNGIAAGGGCELALACHIRLASESATFSLPETKLGMLPAYGGTQRTARSVGTSRALELMLTGQSLSAHDALRYGLINRVVEPAHLLMEAQALARTISGLAPLAIRACLKAVTRGIDLPLEQGLELEAELFSSLFETEDVREGTRAFLEKRPPVFKGR
ncbi:MAG: enoyl-CoA hydratase/isomerase family protein [Pyrinomonadaceae bacterium]|nr:enoyl-CoA hydratase/isomerase family protein [Pyrinomonadaceae bacterium]